MVILPKDNTCVLMGYLYNGNHIKVINKGNTYMTNYIVQYETIRGWICIYQGADLGMANEWLEFYADNHPHTTVRLITEEA